MRTQVYSWRLSEDTKSELERHARALKKPISSILEMAVRDWLDKSAADPDDAENQRRIRANVAKCIGSIKGGNPNRASTARETIRKRLRKRYAR